MPLFRCLNKRQGRQLLQELGAPEALYKKVPTADLEDGKPMIADEVALGVTYDEIDDYLEGKTVSPNAQQTIENCGAKHSINGICQYQSLTTLLEINLFLYCGGFGPSHLRENRYPNNL